MFSKTNIDVSRMDVLGDNTYRVPSENEQDLWTWGFVHMGICAHGDLWTWGFVDMGICGHGDLWTWGFVDMGICGHGDLWTRGFVDTGICGHGDLWTWGFVDMGIGLCEYLVGLSGGPCQHKYILSKQFNLLSFDTISTESCEMRAFYHFLGTGQRENPTWYRPLHLPEID